MAYPSGDYNRGILAMNHRLGIEQGYAVVPQCRQDRPQEVPRIGVYDPSLETLGIKVYWGNHLPDVRPEDRLDMRVVFFTGAAFQTDELFRYMFAHVAARYPDVHIVAVRARVSRDGWSTTLRRHLKKMRRLGLLPSVEILSSYPLQRWLGGRDEHEVQVAARGLPRPDVSLRSLGRAQYVETVNGADAATALGALRPDIIIQREPAFCASRCSRWPGWQRSTSHHGIAPLIRGMHSIYWGLWEDRPEWLGATVHRIDAGIDTGDVLAYAPVAPLTTGEGFPVARSRDAQEAAARAARACCDGWRPGSGGACRHRLAREHLPLDDLRLEAAACSNLKLARRATSR